MRLSLPLLVLLAAAVLLPLAAQAQTCPPSEFEADEYSTRLNTIHGLIESPVSPLPGDGVTGITPADVRVLRSPWDDDECQAFIQGAGLKNLEGEGITTFIFKAVEGEHLSAAPSLGEEPKVYYFLSVVEVEEEETADSLIIEAWGYVSSYDADYNELGVYLGGW